MNKQWSVVAPVGSECYQQACNHMFWCDKAPFENGEFRQGDIVFCKIDEVWRLFRALRRTRKRIVLVTGEGDKPASPELYQQKPSHVFHWFGMNMFAKAPDVTPLPLGLGVEGHPTTLDWQDIQEAQANPPLREHLLYANFGTVSNPIVREPLAEWVRRSAQSWMTVEDHLQQDGQTSYLRNLMSHHFVFCPPGNGEDTHRMWEALYCGAIPVIRKSPAMRTFSDLPILFVDRLDGINEKQLQKVLMEWKTKQYSVASLDITYWRDQFRKAQESARAAGPMSQGEWLAAWMKEIRRVYLCKFKNGLTIHMNFSRLL